MPCLSSGQPLSDVLRAEKVSESHRTFKRKAGANQSPRMWEVSGSCHHDKQADAADFHCCSASFFSQGTTLLNVP